MNTKGRFSKLLDELVSGNPHGDVVQTHLDLILTWLARPDSEKVKDFRDAYLERNIADEILRGYVLFILEQKLFANDSLSAHEVFGLPLGATKEDIKSRYQKLIRVYHPDRGIGDARILHQHSEKINKAYKVLSDSKTTDRQFVSTANVIKPTNNKTNETYNKYKSSPVTRELRKRIGDVKKFQIIFFGAVATFCLLLILLIYIQPEPSISTQTKSIDSSVQLKKDWKESSVQYESNIDDSLSNLEKYNEKVIESKEEVSSDDYLVEETEGSGQLKNSVVSSESELQEPGEIFEENEEKLLPQILNSENIDTNITVDKERESNEKIVDPSDISAKKVVETEQNPTKEKDIVNADASLKSVKNSDLKINRVEPIEKPKIELTSPLKKITGNKLEKKQPIDSEIEKTAKRKEKVVEAVTLEARNVEPKKPANEANKKAPIKEVDVSNVYKPAKNIAKANLFERRFARNFVIKYLESIERGNVSLINDFLSDKLSVNGVSNSKYNYLKNTTQMITSSDKRSYRINFVGDVLRLEKGSFRVILKEHQTVIFKNNRKSQKSTTKSYDIKRYSFGSEIVSISDV